MRSIRLQELENHLGEHLREVREEGQELAVVDRETAIALIVPYNIS
ncbi:MAG: hypothetical protein GY856_27905 [bacterium]|nr:hypothetical protein [bacterium]